MEKDLQDQTSEEERIEALLNTLTPTQYSAFKEVGAERMNLQEMIITAALASGLIALIISFLTVSFHSFKAAQQNPIKALRYE